MKLFSFLFIGILLVVQAVSTETLSAESVPSAMGAILINEIRIDQLGTDDDEYFELIGAGSLNDLTYIVIGDGTGGDGTIEAVVDLSGQTIPGDGYFVAAEATFTLGSADFITTLNFENGDNVTHLLVSDFTGSNGDDLDTNDDGTLDTTPWSNIEDCIALIDDQPSNATYCATIVGPDGTFLPGHVFRTDTSWAIGDFTLGGDDTPGAENGSGGGGCTTIMELQGRGTATPCEGFNFDIPGCITGISARGFYFQDVTGDGDSSTSDGIFVYMGSTWDNSEGLAVGDAVEVSGSVVEFFGMTEFEFTTELTVTGSCTVPAPVTVAPYLNPTIAPETLYEQYEGMRASMTFDGWVVGPTKRFNSRFAAGDPEIAFVDFGSTIADYERVFESDFAGVRGINFISGGLDQDLPDLDFGDDFGGTNVTGVFAYNFGKFQLLIDSATTFTTVDNTDVSSSQPPANTAAGEYDVCFFNVENLFDNINDGMGDWGDWAPGWPTSGSPAGAAIYQAKLDGLAQLIVNDMRSCMVIGLQEVEGKAGIYNDLAAAVTSADGVHTFSADFTPSGDGRNITQGFLWRDDVQLLSGVSGVSGAPYTSWVADGTLDFRRTPATAEFRFNAGDTNETDVTLYAYHFKSKRSSTSCTELDCTDVRELEAADMRDILIHHQTAGEFAIGGGDLNDYLGSSPIDILDAGSADFANLFLDLPADERWTYIFSGESEILDYLYATNNLLGSVSAYEFGPLHVNADFPSAEHISDHDPIRLRLSPNTPTAVSVSSNEVAQSISFWFVMLIAFTLSATVIYLKVGEQS